MALFCAKRKAEITVTKGQKLTLAEMENTMVPDEVIDYNINSVNSYFDDQSWQYVLKIGKKNVLILKYNNYLQ